MIGHASLWRDSFIVFIYRLYGSQKAPLTQIFGFSRAKSQAAVNKAATSKAAANKAAC
jgi:hypothetical protein